MKKTLLKSVIIALSCLAVQGSSFSQIYLQFPALTDRFWYTACNPSSYLEGLNTAMIDYPQAPACVQGGSLIVSDYYGSGTNGGVSFLDYPSLTTFNIPYCGTGNDMMSSPDIIVGNDQAAPRTDYIVAAAYVTGSGNPRIDYYRAHYTGCGTFLPPTLIDSTLFSGFNSATVHLDIIAEYGNTAATGYPLCNSFIVTWDDASSGHSYAIELALNPIYAGPPIAIGTFGLVTLMDPSGHMIAPDVAGIQRLVYSCATCTPTVDNLGLFVTTDQLSGSLYYQEYDFAAGSSGFTSGSPTLLGAYAPSSLQYPRIDAPDNYLINALPPAGSGPSIYKVAVQYYDGFDLFSYTYDNYSFSLAATPVDDASYMNCRPYSPSVAYGGNGGTQYQVSHVATVPYGDDVYIEPINWMHPLAADIPDTWLGRQPYYRVNSIPWGFVSTNYLNAISTPCNNPSDLTLCAWSVNTSAGSNVYYKVTNYGRPSGYNFRQSSGAAPVTNDNWDVYPNPASSMLTVDYPDAAGKYRVIDILGRTLMQGALQQGTQQLDISELTPGSYLLLADNESGNNNHAAFVKQ